MPEKWDVLFIGLLEKCEKTATKTATCPKKHDKLQRLSKRNEKRKMYFPTIKTTEMTRYIKAQ